MSNTDRTFRLSFPQFSLRIGDATARSYPPVDPSLVYFPITCDETPSSGNFAFELWYTVPAEGGAQIFNLGTKFSIVAQNDQVVTVAASVGVHTVWSIESIDASPFLFTIWLSGQDLVWTRENNRIVLRPPGKDLPEQEIGFGFLPENNLSARYWRLSAYDQIPPNDQIRHRKLQAHSSTLKMKQLNGLNKFKDLQKYK
ncbi:hypothetical protein P691DRAFT_781088 [Macrolepiota fuliginosa MF-IS2]|uniref:Uncharacterized protein n=1 Tax=Macrolepiota fuliginosa MF-IS2 TaxID=1400762 RepID=A0A9P5XCA6_9AGAR|nr:hypothetical protein P691DRAFT_781088 [Macrolepiota fuliginosa MF-IS2]